jgi:hypothetical protein
MDEPGFDSLHVLIADENKQRLDEIATGVSDLGHGHLEADRGLSSRRRNERERPDVAVVGLGLERAHAWIWSQKSCGRPPAP